LKKQHKNAKTISGFSPNFALSTIPHLAKLELVRLSRYFVVIILAFYHLFMLQGCLARFTPIEDVNSVHPASDYRFYRRSKSYTKTEVGAGLELNDVYQRHAM
jgi:hypothetical protein